MGLKESIDSLKYDARMVDINLKSQTLTQAEWQKHLEKLPDLQRNAEGIEFEKESSESWNS